MSRRTNFLDGNDNFREQNLRFVRNEFEDNMNQFFGGAKGGPGMSQQQQQKPPARDSLIVQPTPGTGGARRGAIIGTGNPEVDQRRQFLRQMGVNRNKARSLVKRSFKVPNFNLRDFQRKRFRLSVELGDNRQKEVDAIIIREFFDFIDANEPRERPRTPSPPRNINWNDDLRPPPPRPRNAILEDTVPREAFERNEEELRFARSRSPDVDRHGPSNDRWQQQQQQDDFPQSSNRNSNFQFQNENDNFRQQREQIVDVDRHYRPQERFDLTDRNEDLERINRSHQMNENDRYSPRPMRLNRSPEYINDNFNNNNNFERDFGNPDLNPHARDWDRTQDFRGDSERNLDDRNPDSRNADYEPVMSDRRQLSPPRRNLNSSSFQNKEPNYQRFVQMDDGNEDRVFLIRDPDSDSRDVGVNIRSNEFHNEQRNFMDNRAEHFEEGRNNNPNRQHFLNNNEEFQRSDYFRQNIGPGNADDHQYNFMNNDRPNEFVQDRNERNFNNNNNNRQEILNDEPSSYDFRNRNPNQFENDRFNNQERGGQNLDGNDDFHRNDESFGNFLQRPDNDRFDMQERDGQPDFNDFQRNQSFQQNFSSNQHDRRDPIPPNANRYQGNRTDVGNQSMRNGPRNNSRGGGGPQRTGRMDRPNPVTATITSQQTGGRRPPPPAIRTGNRNSSFGGAPLVAKYQARADITNANRNQVGNRANVRPPIDAPAATNPGQVAENKANSPRTGQKRASVQPASSRLTMAELKQRKIAGKQRVFRIAGFEFPYMSSSVFRLPQPESESYALTFFEQKPNYFTNYLMEYLGDEGQIKDDKYNDDDDDDNSDDDESIEKGPRIAGGKTRRYANKRIRQNLQLEWIKIYKKSNYKYWHIWWKDYKWCGAEIEKQLETFDNISVKHRFIPIYPNATNEEVINKVLKRAEINLGKNSHNHFHVMRTIFIIMNETFLENLSKKDVKQLQDIIRYIPNHLWLFKMRSMVYLWERHYDAIKKDQKEADVVRLQWRNPSFHWLARQAFDELKTISEIAWPDHKKLFDG